MIMHGDNNTRLVNKFVHGKNVHYLNNFERLLLLLSSLVIYVPMQHKVSPTQRLGGVKQMTFDMIMSLLCLILHTLCKSCLHIQLSFEKYGKNVVDVCSRTNCIIITSRSSQVVRDFCVHVFWMMGFCTTDLEIQRCNFERMLITQMSHKYMYIYVNQRDIFGSKDLLQCEMQNHKLGIIKIIINK